MKTRFPLLLTASASASALAQLLSPAICSSQSILLSADDFVLLAGTAVTVGGAGPNTFSNGDVGADASISGFPPATVVNGTTILGGVIVGQALDDLITARNSLSAMVSPPANNLTGVNGGDLATQILTPGVYTFDVAASLSLNGVITLDAQGQNNVVWVFNIGTSLTTGENAEVQFINLGTNGGSDNGLFWNTGSAITFGATNIIAGNYLAGTDITFGTTVPTTGSGSGRALALAGVSFDGTGTMDALGAPGNGDLAGGLTIVAGQAVTSGYVLLSKNGTYDQGMSSVVLSSGKVYNTPNVIVDGDSSDTLLATPATFTVFHTIATLTGTNTYTGGTFIDAGKLTTASENLPTDGSISFIDSNSTGTPGELVFDQSTDATFGGVIDGDGSLTKENTGTLTLTAENTYTGGTIINGGTLATSTVLLPFGQDVSLATDTILVLDEAAGNNMLAGNVTGDGTIQKEGVGALYLANSTTAKFNLIAGSLMLSNDVGATTVGLNGFLGGTGTVNGDFINNGIVSPGFSPGTVNVIGNYNQSSTGTLVIEIASAVSFDQLLITGTATVAGTLQIDTLGVYNPVGESFTFLTADLGVTGTFDSITGSAAVDATVTYNANDSVISFAQIPFSTFAGTPNQVAVSEAALLSPEITTALNAVPLASQMPAALNALSPQGYEVWSDIAFAHASSLANRLERQPMAEVGRDNLYFEASRNRGRTRSDSDVGTTNYRTEAGLVGGNYVIAPNLTVGGFFEYSKSTSGLGSSGSETKVEDLMPGVRIAWEQGAWFASASAGFGFDDYESTREINFQGTSATAESDTSGHQWFVDIRGGRNFTAGMVSLTPFAGIQASGWKADGFTETGAGAFNATVADQSARSLRSQLGLRSGIEFAVGTAVVRPRVTAAWIHEFNNDARSMNSAFGDINYKIETRKAQRDSARFGVGLDVGLTNDLMIYADYSVETGSVNRTTGELRAGLAFNF